MGETVEVKIKILRRMFTREKQASESFSELAQNLKENECYIKVQLNTLESNMKTAANLDRQIVAMSDEDDAVFVEYTNNRVYEDLRDLYCLQAMKYSELLNSCSSTLDHNAFDANSTQISSNQHNISNLPNLRLPTINIEPFDGNYANWADFKDIFESSINNNPTLCNSTKLQYLQAFLKGEALKVIKRGSERLKPENYNSIWASLIKRYEHKRSLSNSYFHMLFNQSPITRETSKDLKNLHDTTYDALSSLKNMGLETEAWGDMLVFLIYSKLPLNTKELWEEKIGINDELPKFDTFMQFIETRFRTLEGIEATKSQMNDVKRRSFTKKTTLHTEVGRPNKSKGNVQTKCKCCQKESHYLSKCEKFRQMNPNAKVKFVRQNDYCYNCLGFHRVESCTSTSRCRECNKKHHTVLHIFQNVNGPQNQSEVSQPPSSIGVQSTSDGRFSESYATMVSKSNSCVLFPTALVNVVNNNGYSMQFRALIDACSDESYITERVVKKLQLRTKSVTVETTGLGGEPTVSSQSITSFSIRSITQEFSANIKAYVIPKISSHRPIEQFNKSFIPDDIDLADPNFNIPDGIDLLLGGNIDALISMNGCIRYSQENIVLRQTKLGWLASGGKAQSQCFTITSQEHKVDNKVLISLDQNLRRFWEIEETPKEKILTKEEKLAEKIYESTTKRLEDGKYVVSLPFEKKVIGFSNMRKIAMTRYFQLENKLSKNEECVMSIVIV